MDRYNKMVEEDSKVLEMRIKNAHKGTEDNTSSKSSSVTRNYQKQMMK
jgi:hypothetical protein